MFSYPKTTVALPFLLGLVTLIGGIAWGLRNYYLYKNAIETEGIVVDVYNLRYFDSRTKTSKIKSWPIIEFTASNGKKYRFKGHLSTGAKGYKEIVLYNPANPENATVSSFSYTWLPSVISVFIGLIFIYTGWVNKREYETVDF